MTDICCRPNPLLNVLRANTSPFKPRHGFLERCPLHEERRVFLIFSSGILVCAGAKKEKNVVVEVHGLRIGCQRITIQEEGAEC